MIDYRGILTDRQIRQIVEHHKMLDPYIPHIARHNEQGAPIISYGSSSFGYDIRVGTTFQIFTSPLDKQGVIDPKNFDRKLLRTVEVEPYEACFIPPHSFSLARSMESFKMPRNITGIAIGKSTYARCFRGDTKVALVDGTSLSLEEMAVRSETGEMFWGYSVGPYGRIMVTLLDSPRYIGRDTLIELVLDNGEPIYCTPDHLFILRDGREMCAGELRSGDSLMPLYRQVCRGYEMVYQPLNGQLHPTHRLSDEWNIRNEIYSDIPGTHRHHIDHVRSNNNPWNIERMDAGEHIRYHNNKNYGEDFDPVAHSESVKAGVERARSADPGWDERISAYRREQAYRLWHDDKYASSRVRITESHLANWTTDRRRQQSERLRTYYQDPEHIAIRSEIARQSWANDNGTRRANQAQVAREARSRHDIDAIAVREALDKTGSIRAAARFLNCDRSVFRRFPEVLADFRGHHPRNHKVLTVSEVPGVHDVFCLTVPESGNFALESGVFVHNCNIICNITPLEAGWEGILTIEIHNTTALPAKVYACEGICQILFFAGDQPDVSYADRGGKYQGQTGITLPKV